MVMKICSHLVGKTGGELKEMSDITFHIKNNITSLIQEAHMSLSYTVFVKIARRKT
jgi:phosphoheptose isomerase